MCFSARTLDVTEIPMKPIFSNIPSILLVACVGRDTLNYSTAAFLKMTTALMKLSRRLSFLRAKTKPECKSFFLFLFFFLNSITSPLSCLHPHLVSSRTCTHHPIFLPRLSVSFHSSLSLSAYLTTMATGDVAALTGMRLIENNSVQRVGHARKHAHVCTVAGPPSLIDTIP